MMPRGVFARVTLAALVILASLPESAQAQEKRKSCAASDRACLLREMETLIPTIDNADWRDQSYRELAKTYAYEGQIQKALALIPKVSNNDTRAMTIRGIGMGAASAKLAKTQYAALWKDLNAEAAKITHAPSQGIAYTYISMSQVYAGDDAAARETASKMTNAALRNKAYGEAAEIEADRGDLPNALLSLAAIDAPPYRDKQYDIVSKIFIDKGMASEAYECAGKISNSYLRAKAVQRILNKGNPEEEDLQAKTEAKDTE
jgi:hypothetical protein